MTPYFTPATAKAAFEARFHFGWYTHGRQATLSDHGAIIDNTVREVASRRNYHVLELDVEPCVVRTLLSLTPETSPAEVTRYVKGNVATAVRNACGVNDLWSRGWFLRSVGHVTTEVVRSYVDKQYDHHRAAPVDAPTEAAKAGYRHPGDARTLRSSNHAKYEYNAHFVFVTHRRREFLDLRAAEALVGYWRRVCEKKQWLPWSIEVVWNHAHLFLGLSPSDAPGEVALSLLNNAEHLLGDTYRVALPHEIEQTVWQPGYYVGTVGAATTAQVKAFLARGEG